MKAFATLAVLIALVASASAACTTIYGGASAFASMGGALALANHLTYASSSALLGIQNFNNGLYCIGVSDNPMTVLQENSGPYKASGKYTLPITLATYSVYYGYSGSGKLTLSVSQVYSIYSNPSARTWSLYSPPAGLAAKITPYARGDGSGANYLIKQWWSVMGHKTVLPYDESPFKFSGLTYVSGAAAYVAAAAKVAGSICYSQSGVAHAQLGHGLTEAYLINAAGIGVAAGSAVSVAAQVIPRTLPQKARDSSWAAISLIGQPGASTPPIASFEYHFIAKGSTRINPGTGTTAKNLLTYVIKYANTYAPKYYYIAVPTSIVSGNLAILTGV
jgi:hypothetical protein